MDSVMVRSALVIACLSLCLPAGGCTSLVESRSGAPKRVAAKPAGTPAPPAVAAAGLLHIAAPPSAVPPETPSPVGVDTTVGNKPLLAFAQEDPTPSDTSRAA